eukprot:3656257-Karenia_brevis.AAC.1
MRDKPELREKWRRALKNLWKVKRQESRMKNALRTKSQAEMKDWSFSRDRKFVKVNRCIIKDTNNALIEVSEWPKHISAHLAKIFSAPEDEKCKVNDWFLKTKDDCIKTGHIFSDKQISEGA